LNFFFKKGVRKMSTGVIKPEKQQEKAEEDELKKKCEDVKSELIACWNLIP
jgi:hypothetical protein